MTPRGHIVLIYATLAGNVAFGISAICIMGIWPPWSPALGDAAVAAFYREHGEAMRVGAVILLTVSGYNIPLAAVVTDQMLRLGPKIRMWAIFHAMGGALMAIWLAIPAMFFAVTAFTPERDPALTRLMHEMSQLSVWVSIQFFVLQGVAFSYVCLSHKVDSPYFPRWLGYLTLWGFVVTEYGVFGLLVKSGPYAMNGFYIFWFPACVFFVGWYAPICYVFIKNLRADQRTADSLEEEGVNELVANR